MNRLRARLCGPLYLPTGRGLPCGMAPQVAAVVCLGLLLALDVPALGRPAVAAGVSASLGLLAVHFARLARAAWRQWLPVVGQVYLLMALLTSLLAAVAVRDVLH
ncbi:MAG: hypothetical protein AAGA92_01690 [Planctomycetota bacterium]